MTDKCECNLCDMIEHTTWVSVKDRLPDEGVRVLSYSPDHYDPIMIDYIIYSHRPFWACRLFRDDDRYKVTHWMPLPSTKGLI